MRGMVGFVEAAFYIPVVVDWQTPDELLAALAEAKSVAVLTGAGVSTESRGLICPDIVWFGELSPDGVLEEAEAAVRNASVFVSVGTSGTVYPAASLAPAAHESGALLVEINPEPSEQSDILDVTPGRPSGIMLPASTIGWGSPSQATERWQTGWLGNSNAKHRR